MKTVAFLQNQWFKNPERIARMYEGNTLDQRCRRDQMFLFYRCLTGRRLRHAFGEEVCLGRDIVWANASPKIGGKSSAKFPADPEHMLSILEYFNPKIVITFGAIAQDGWKEVCRQSVFELYEPLNHLHGPHPAARHSAVISELRSIADQWKKLVQAA